MGRLNTRGEQEATVRWGSEYEASSLTAPATSIQDLLEAFLPDLNSYFALACLARSRTAPQLLVLKAEREVFRVRVSLEQAIAASAHGFGLTGLYHWSSGFYGCSRKQGVSVRLPLSSCVPTSVCGAYCYAHDVLDAAPRSVVRGAVNGKLAACYESGDPSCRQMVMDSIHPATRRAVRAADIEASKVGTDFQREPRIRLAHVGEIAAWPEFADALARQVLEISDERVTPVVYTRHPNATKLDASRMVINFTLDESSLSRAGWVPPDARLVFAAVGGRTSSTAAVNFLEHHRWQHTQPSGDGNVCAATLPDTPVRSCDAVHCDLCFRQPRGGE